MIAPIITSGNTVVVIAAQHAPLAAMTLAEVLATSDVPGGVVNILTGDPAEIAPHLAAHADVNALDLTGTAGQLRTDLERAAAGTVKRVYAPGPRRTSRRRRAPPGCGRSWRSRPSGTRPARCRWPAAAATDRRRDGTAALPTGPAAARLPIRRTRWPPSPRRRPTIARSHR